MKILYFAPVSWNWARQRPHFIAEALAGAGHEVVFFSIIPFGRKKSPCGRSGAVMVEERHVLPLALRFPLIDRWNACRIRRLLACRDFDAVVLTNPRQRKFLPEHLLSHARLIYDCMDNLPFFYSGRIRARMAEEERELCRMVSAISASSDYLKNALVERCGVSRDKVTVIRNAVSRNFLSGEGKAIPLPAPNLVYLGTVAEWLDWETLRTYARRHPDVSLIFIGPGSPNIRRGMPRNMIFLPPVPHREICRYLRSADVLLLPFQVNELIRGVDPVKLYEYLSLNRPVVASYWEELDHFSRSGGIHFYRSPDDFESAAAKAFAAARTKLPPDEQFYRENLWEKRFPAFLALLDATGRVD